MKIIILGLDANILDENSQVARRFKQYGGLVERLDVLVPGSSTRTKKLSDTVTIHSVKSSNKLVNIWRLIKSAAALIKEHQPDLISTRDPYYLGLAARYLAKKYQLALEIQVHGFEKFTFLRRLIARRVLKSADGIRTVSKRLAQQISRDFDIDADRIVTIPIFVDCQRFQRKHEAEKAEGPFTFITVSRLVPIKNIEVQMRALSHLNNQARLMVVGAGLLEKELKSLSEKLGLAEQITFSGFVEDVRPLLAQADCFLLSSRAEGYGLAPIEAACFGLPVIMTDVGCAHEVINDHENGLIIPVDDEAALLSAMKQIMADQGLREMIRKNNRQLHTKIPSEETSLALYQESWQRVLAHYKRRR
ncbi:MAG: glycosyltransferase family 4 protein [Candidatus Harrisonbacteria bacterium]|nr:glycosyltransferase family 4 protein [Candidatus Harrisonbacteria bacterium]